MRAVPRFVAQLGVALALTFVACDSATAPDPLGPNDVRGFVTTSSANPAVNDVITVTFGVKRGTEAAMIGSVSGNVTFDATAFEFVAENHPASNNSVIAMAVVQPGVAAFAAASADGFSGENIAAMTVKVLKTGAVQSIGFSVSELTNVNLEAKTP